MNQELRIKNRASEAKYIIALVLFCVFMIYDSNFMILPTQAATGVGTGIVTSVKDNEFSRAAEQLRQKATELDQRQAALNALEQKIAKDNKSRDQILVLLALVLFTLIGMNYYLDFHRRKQGLIKLSE